MRSAPNSLKSTLPLNERLFSPIGKFKSNQYPSDTMGPSPGGEKNELFPAAVNLPTPVLVKRIYIFLGLILDIHLF